MIQLKTEIPDTLVDPLEEYFCEWVPSPWMIIESRVGQPTCLHGYFETEEEAAEAWQAVRVKFKHLPETLSPEVLADRDWKEAYKDHFKPWSLCGLHWVPEWERAGYAVPGGEAAVYLDPGMAFGTGDHPTTRLMAEALLEYKEALGDDFASANESLHVIDAGCGSGILALSAVALGFQNVYGFDRDPEAARISLENAAVNGMEGKVAFSEAGIEDGLAGRKADLMLANIQADVLTIYAEELLGAMNPGGTLALTGILTQEVEPVRDHFRDACSKLGIHAQDTAIRSQGEWSAVIIRLA